MRQAARRLRTLERVATAGRYASIPPDRRWWCALCETEQERHKCLSEPVTWADMERDWLAALEEVSGETE